MRDDVPPQDMGESPIVVKYSDQKRFANCFYDLIFRCTLQVDPFLELPRRLSMVVVEVSCGDDICPWWDYELTWIGRDDERGSRCHDHIDSVWL